MYQHDEITKKVNNLIKYYDNGRKYDSCDKTSQSFFFNFDWSKYVDEKLKNEIEFIIESNESLAEK